MKQINLKTILSQTCSETKEKTLEFSELLQSRLAVEFDNSVMFECRASESCREFKWYFGEIELSDDTKYQTRRNGDTFWLRITDLTLEDAGIYSCGIQDNRGRRAFTSAELRVAGLSQF